jgi:hypothetical protein
MMPPDSHPGLRLLTIGVYGYTEAAFFQALQEAGVDTFCDVRYRRGVRGREYAFANRQRLEHRLGQMGIRYLHFRDLAPSPALRAQQAAADQRTRTAKRQRTALSQDFVRGYRVDCLQQLDAAKFLERLGPERAWWLCSAWNAIQGPATARCWLSGCRPIWGVKSRI